MARADWTVAAQPIRKLQYASDDGTHGIISSKPKRGKISKSDSV